MQAASQAIDLGGMIEGIRRWVETESPTRDAAAVNRMVDVVMAGLEGLPVAVERKRGRNGFADMLAVRSPGAGDRPGILILSHIDTVHPLGTLAGPLPFRRDGDKAYGEKSEHGSPPKFSSCPRQYTKRPVPGRKLLGCKNSRLPFSSSFSQWAGAAASGCEGW